MSKNRSFPQRIDLVFRVDVLRGVAAAALALALAGCGGGGGSSTAATSPASPITGGSAGGTAALAAAATLNMGIQSVTINSPPVVNFTVTDQNGVGMVGLVDTDLRFNIAKLVPGQNGEPSTWQNYINVASGGAVQGGQERKASGFAWGTLINHGDGSYTYTFATDIKSATTNPCPAPCTDAAGKALDISYQPNFTHRVTIQQANGTYPNATASFDFVPSGGTGAARDVVVNATCNQCHEQLTAHGTRVDVKLCVTCHNPGSWVAGAANVPVDFKVMIHRIHYNNNGTALPSVISTTAPTPYVVAGTDFSAVTFPQDVRSCSRCHDGSISAQGDNWKMQPSMQACGSCHDDVYFGTKPDPAKPYQILGHPGGVQLDNSGCALCHEAGKFTGPQDIVVAHNFPTRFKAASAKFQYNIVSVTPTTAGSAPVITFSVTDPTNNNAPYDIKAAPAFTAGANSTLTVKLGWTKTGIADIGNDGNGQSYGQPISINLLNNAAVVAGTTAGTYTVTSTTAIPAGQTGTLRVMMEGHPAGDVTTAGTFTDRLKVKSVFKDFAVTGTATARRAVVDVAKCDVCHGVLSLHGNNRTEEPQVCAVCHNPNATDAARRPQTAGVLTGGVDGKLEESIDFKRMIHGIHAGQASNGGFRTTGLVVYGFGGSVNDFSKVVFPGKLRDCTMCHAGTSYQLTGIWTQPTANGILGSTISSGASATDPTDNLRISPIAAVCSSCHDSAVAKLHIQDPAQGGNFSATQAALNAAVPESCGLCHGSGAVFDVKVVHKVQ